MRGHIQCTKQLCFYTIQQPHESGGEIALATVVYSINVSIAICIPSLKAYSKMAASARLIYSFQQSWNFSKVSFCSSVNLFSSSSWCRAMYCTANFACWEKALDYSPEVWYTIGRRITRHGGELLVVWSCEVQIFSAWIVGSKSGLTTPLTIYRLGLCGNSAYKSIGKHRFQTQKHRKVAKIT